MKHNINPFDILSGKVVQNHYGTFWFKNIGYNTLDDGFPIWDNLEKALFAKIINGTKGIFYFKEEASNNIGKDGLPIWNNLHRTDGPAATFTFTDPPLKYWVMDMKVYTEREFKKKIKCLQMK